MKYNVNRVRELRLPGDLPSHAMAHTLAAVLDTRARERVTRSERESRDGIPNAAGDGSK